MLYKQIRFKNVIQPPNKLSSTYPESRPAQSMTKREHKSEKDSKKDFLVNSKLVNNEKKYLENSAFSFDCK